MADSPAAQPARTKQLVWSNGVLACIRRKSTQNAATQQRTFMFDQARSLSEAVGRFVGRDPTLKYINLYNMRYTDAELGVLVDCLLAHPDVVVHLRLHFNRLTDGSGAKLARCLAASSTIESLGLSNSLFGTATYLALRVNSSLRD